MRPGAASVLGLAVFSAGALALADGGGAPPLRLALEDGCPERGALVDALGTEGLRVRDDDAAAWRLAVRPRGALVAVELADASGGILLERVLPGGDCGALAEAVALLVGRRVQTVDGDVALPAVDLPAPTASVPHLEAAAPLAPASDPWAFEGRAGVLASTGLRSDASFGPFAGVRLDAPTTFTAVVSAGWLHSDVPVPDGGALAIDRLPLALGLGARIAWTSVAIGAYATGQAEVFRVRSDLAGATTETRAAFHAGPRVSLVWMPLPHVAIGADLGLLARLFGYRFVVDGLGDVGGQAPLAFEAMLSLGWRTESIL